MSKHTNIPIDICISVIIQAQGGIKSIWVVRTGHWMLVQWDDGMKPVFKFTRGNM